MKPRRKSRPKKPQNAVVKLLAMLLDEQRTLIFLQRETLQILQRREDARAHDLELRKKREERFAARERRMGVKEERMQRWAKID